MMKQMTTQFIMKLGSSVETQRLGETLGCSGGKATSKLREQLIASLPTILFYSGNWTNIVIFGKKQWICLWCSVDSL